MEEIQKKIIEYIRKNRVSTTEVADCLGKSGVVEDVLPINRGHFRVGKVYYTYGIDETTWFVHEQIRRCEPGDVVVVDSINCNKRSLFGELVAKFALLYREATAIVALGNVRDANDLIKQNYPVWMKGVSPVGCFMIPPQKKDYEEIVSKYRKPFEGAIAVCDDTGVVLIPKEQQTEEFYKKLEFIEEQEDIWFDCIDRAKWDTFEVVCLKRYLKENQK